MKAYSEHPEKEIVTPGAGTFKKEAAWVSVTPICCRRVCLVVFGSGGNGRGMAASRGRSVSRDRPEPTRSRRRVEANAIDLCFDLGADCWGENLHPGVLPTSASWYGSLAPLASPAHSIGLRGEGSPTRFGLNSL